MLSNAGAGARALGDFAQDGALKTTEVGVSFESLIKEADKDVEKFIHDKAGTNGRLELSAGESLQLQRLMGDQSITVQTGTATLKSIKDSISSAARNI
ncbi:hypothetical protein ABLB37_14215 [Vibrio parahaemolyticus]|uniref:Uncharacterized protein n=3 Tax=Vibrio parahaemolyticus TaxID=670 RepID=A0A0L8TN24_VIBPH|nr:hypothetical protein [Vibrio parahaemolyticus]EFO35387.1 conserved hypothetical protein [Vibrio parahaemolyticus Peru-466]EFO49617.1 conserved hypothetical protein [Vibrio parahaemolyticus K5030]EVU11245.1 hypothetical protein D046_7528 [Vibrio parahaemolyticus V-223/04]ARC21004.1 hypothetical protein A6J30_21415 [Vibrio parahaemolyticus]AZV73628.1 hypothetical protein D0853_22000 [Vibrio parahaemolyticus]